jgi:RNA polymerase sigma-70 factor (ECF subfamily)
MRGSTDLAEGWYHPVIPIGGRNAVGLNFAAAVREHKVSLRALALRLCRNSADADDLVQDTLERALRRFDLLKPGSNVRSWLLMVLHHRFIDLCRLRARHPSATSLDGHDATALTEDAAPWDSITEEDVQAAVARLPDDLRDAYELRIHELRSYEEIGRILGIATMTVGTRLMRARRRLRELLEPKLNLPETSSSHD